MNPALSPRSLPRSQGLAVSKKVIGDPMAPDFAELEPSDDIFERPLTTPVAAERTLESNRALHATDDMDGHQVVSGASGLAALLSPFSWLTDRVMSSDARVRISGSAKAIYSLAVRSVMGARAQMESYSPPFKGEFSHKLSLKWGIVRLNPLLKGQFVISPAPGLAGRAGEYSVGLRARLPLLSVLPWVLGAAIPAIVPVLINLIVGFSWHGPALAAGWVALTGLPMIMSYVGTARRATRIFAAQIMSGLTEEALIASQSDRSSIIALVPARPVLSDQEEEALEAVMPARPRPVAQPVAVAPKHAPAVAPAKPIIPAEPVAALLKPFKTKPAEPKKAMTMDAQALVKAQMATQVQAQLEAQLEALNKAEIELKATPKVTPKPQPVEAASTVSSARVRSRIKKFRTRYDVASKPAAETTPEPQAPQGLKVKV